MIFPVDGNLEIIESWAFHDTAIKEFVAPPTLRTISDYAFYMCS